MSELAPPGEKLAAEIVYDETILRFSEESGVIKMGKRD